MMHLLFLCVVHVAVALHSKPASSLEQTSQQGYPSYGRGYNTYNSYDSGNDDIAEMANGYSVLSSQTKAVIEQCIIDDFIIDELSCGNNPYSGLVRLAFHDCGTSDPTNTSFPGGCNAWMSKKCTEYDACEFTAHENNGLQKWVTSLDAMYDNARLNGQRLSTYLSRADFWHLSAHYAVKKSSAGNVNLTYWSGRVDPDMSWGPRFVGRLPGAFAWSEMQRVGRRNNMSDFSASALLGAHTLGHAHPQISGFQGSWDPTPFVFDEQYYKVLLNLQWFERYVQSVDSQTGLATNSTQYSLGPDNIGATLMLFADMGQHANISGGCPAVNDPIDPCPNNTNNPTGLSGALNAWANVPSTFYSAFKIAFENMSKWGSSNLVNVSEYTGNVRCGYNSYYHKCNKMYKTAPSWKPQWINGGSSGNNGGTPSPSPTTTTSTSPSSTTTASYYSSAAATTTAVPVTTTAASVPTTAPQYYPVSTPSTPAPRIYIEK